MRLLNAEDYDRLWQYSRKQSSLYNERSDPTRWQEFWDQYAPTYLAISRSLMEDNKRLVRLWLQEGIVSENSTVVDVGCGPGTYTLPLAEVAKSVTGVDNSQMMLDAMMQESARMNIENLQAVSQDWQTTSWSDAFDLVVAANCPAINNLETLEKMTRCARRYCLYIFYAGKRSVTIRDVLWQRVMGEKLQGKPFDISFPFNILYQKGFLPRLTFARQQYSYQQPVDTILRNYTKYFAIFGRTGSDVTAVLEQELWSRSPQGVFAETVSSHIAIMWWDVHETK